jgi:multidrug efflux system membrane fusion protein
VLDGLQLGDKVVVDGSDRLREGAKVTLARGGGDHQEGGKPQAATGQGAPPVDAAQQGEGPGGGRRRNTQ